MIKIENFVKFGLKCYNFTQSKVGCNFPDPLGPCSELKTRSLDFFFSIHSLVEGKI